MATGSGRAALTWRQVQGEQLLHGDRFRESSSYMATGSGRAALTWRQVQGSNPIWDIVFFRDKISTVMIGNRKI
jgi:CII-binding regulator of phage lambda lysogenization HflD